MTLEREVIQSALEGLILGKKFPPYSCCCGGIRVGESVAVSIIAPKEDSPFDRSFYWSVRIREIGKSEDCRYAESLYSFLTEKQIQEVFSSAD